MMSCRCLRVSVWKRRSVDPEVKAIQIPTPDTAMCETTMPSSWWASSWLWKVRDKVTGGHRWHEEPRSCMRSPGSCHRPARTCHRRPEAWGCARGCKARDHDPPHPAAFLSSSPTTAGPRASWDLTLPPRENDGDGVPAQAWPWGSGGAPGGGGCTADAEGGQPGARECGTDPAAPPPTACPPPSWAPPVGSRVPSAGLPGHQETTSTRVSARPTPARVRPRAASLCTAPALPAPRIPPLCPAPRGTSAFLGVRVTAVHGPPSSRPPPPQLLAK